MEWRPPTDVADIPDNRQHFVTYEDANSAAYALEMCFDVCMSGKVLEVLIAWVEKWGKLLTLW